MSNGFRLSGIVFNRSFLQITLAALSMVFFVYFIRNEHLEFADVQVLLSKANPAWVSLGVFVTVLYLIFQGTLYVFAFKSIGVNIGLKSALRLFLKRNFVSTFLPAGMFTSLAFFENELSAYPLQKTHIRFGSFLFALASLISIIVIAIPALGILLLHHQLRLIDIYGTILLIALIGLLAYAGLSVAEQKGIVFRMMIRWSPEFMNQLAELSNQHFRPSIFVQTCLISVAIEAMGITHLYIALVALELQPSLEVSLIGYSVMIIILSLSPFLRGLGAIELSVIYILTLYGFSSLAAASATLLFRFFEFWLPFIVSASLLLIRKGNLLLRVFPALLALTLGVVNIFSSLTPALPERLHLLKNFIPLSIAEFSNVAVIFIGIGMLISSGFLLTGARNAWRITLFISFLSLIGHLVKALDYEEAALALATMFILIYTRKSYFIKHDINFDLLAVKRVMIVLTALLIYSVVGFYLLKAQHLGLDYTWSESLQAAVKTIGFLSGDLTPKTRTGLFFIYSIQISSAFTLAYGLFLLYFDRLTIHPTSEGQTEAIALVNRYGNSPLDYFKLYPDKQLFFNKEKDAFLAFAIARHYAVVLENPVAGTTSAKTDIIRLFEEYCTRLGLRAYYYRVGQDDMPLYESLGKKSIRIGQEAIVDVTTFSMEGATRKSLRNAMNKVEHSGFYSVLYEPPLKDELVQQLKTVSDEWLREQGHVESGFSQGVFLSEQIAQCKALTIEDGKKQIVAFLTIIPDYKSGEATYDLIRQRRDSPNGALDYLLIKLIDYCKRNEYNTLNMGMAPLAGMDTTNMNEQIIQFYKDHFGQALRLKGLYAHKNKFEPRWENRYLIYDLTFDLIQFPGVLRSVSQIISG